MAFRLRIALLSLATSGVLLIGFGIFFLTIIQRVGLERVDREIRALAESQLRGRQPGERWQNVDRSLRFIYGEESSARSAIQVRDAGQEVLFTSPSFPPEIASLAPPVLAFRPRPAGRPDPGSDVADDGRDSGDRPPADEDLLTRLDTDADGRVSIEEFDGPLGVFAEVDADGDGYLMPTEAMAAARHRPPRQKEPVFRTVKTSTGAWRVGFLGNEYVTMVVGRSLADLSRETAGFTRAFLIATPLALLALAAAGWWLTNRALRPVALLTRTAESVTAGGLDQRVPEVATDRELGRLVEVINSMLERLERSFEQAARFSSDAAHELQTPLTVLQGELDNAIQRAAAGSDEQRYYSSLLEEVRRLKAVVHKLLLLARADAGRLDLHLEPVTLSDLLAEAIEDVEAMAPGVRIESAIASGLQVMADPDLLNQVVRNMTGNAVKHGERDGLIRFELAVEDGTVRFTLSNTGEAIAPVDRERIFDRFYRGDTSRDGRVGGSGLGLSLAREIARAHGGELELGPEQPGMTAFTLTLPRAPRRASVARAGASLLMLLLALASSTGIAMAQNAPPREPPALIGFSIIPFDFGPPGARALGMGGAFIALADDATAAEANPAGLTNLSRPEASVHGRTSEFEVGLVDLNAVLSLDALNQARSGAPLASGSAQGSAFASSTEAVFDPSVADLSFASFVKPFENHTVSLSLERVTRFSGESLFEAFDDSLLDYYQTQQRIGLTLDNLGVSFAFKASERLSVGFSMRYGRLTLDAAQQTRADYLQDLELAVLPSGSSLEEVQALGILDQQFRREVFGSTDSDINFNAGLLFNAGGGWSFGAVYKDGGQFELDGQAASFACLAESTAGNVACEPESTAAAVRSIKIPDFLGWGVAWRPSDRLKFALDANWISYSDLSPFEGDAIPPALAADVEGIDDEIEVHLGVEHISFVGSSRRPITLRAGFFTDPDHDGFAEIDSSREAFTLGLGTVFSEQFQVDVAGQASDGQSTVVLSAVYRF